MSLPDECPNCGSAIQHRETSGPRIFFECESWMKDGAGKLTFRTNKCADRKTIRDAACVIRAFLEEDRDARERGFNWIAENTP